MFKFACIVIASLVTFAGMLMSMDMLQQMPGKATNNMFQSGINLHSKYQIKQYEFYSEFPLYHHSGEPSYFSVELIQCN